MKDLADEAAKHGVSPEKIINNVKQMVYSGAYREESLSSVFRASLDMEVAAAEFTKHVAHYSFAHKIKFGEFWNIEYKGKSSLSQVVDRDGELVFRVHEGNMYDYIYPTREVKGKKVSLVLLERPIGGSSGRYIAGGNRKIELAKEIPELWRDDLLRKGYATDTSTWWEIERT